MRPSSPAIALEGLPIIGLAVFVTLVFAILGWSILAVLGIVLTFFCLNFFRDPERVVPSEAGLAVCPADGKVVKVGRAKDPLSGEERGYVAIFMNVFNVHVNRASVTGRVTRIIYHAGKFLNASFDKASTDNERCVIGLRDGQGCDWTMVLIAGLIARRIVCRVEEGDAVGRGQRVAMIKFGSRVDLYFPDDYVTLLHEGDKVLAGQTVACRARETSS